MRCSSINPFHGWFEKLARRSPLNDHEREAILALPGHAVQIQCNRDFVRLGDRKDHATLVVDGLVGRFAESGDGGRQIVALHIAGDMADLHSVVAPQASSALHALAVTTILKVPHSALRDAARRYPAIAEAFWRECVVDSAVLAEWTVNVGRRDSQTRAAHLLCEMACRYQAAGSGTGAGYDFPATQTHMADMMALTPVHVNRVLKQIRERGIAHVHSRSVRILDWDGMVGLGEFDPAYLQLGRSAKDDGEQVRSMSTAGPMRTPTMACGLKN